MSTRAPAPRVVFPLFIAAIIIGGAAYATPRIVQRHRDTALFDAVCRRDVANVRRLLDAGANPNAPQIARMYRETGGGLWRRALRYVLPSRFDRAGMITVLPIDAAMSRDTENDNQVSGAQLRQRTLSLLLTRGANPNAFGPGQNPPLYRAVSYGDDASAQMLLIHGAKPDLPGDDDKTDFRVNGDYGWYCTKSLFRKPRKVTPLMVAARQGDLIMIRALLKRHADPNAKDDQMGNALHHTVGLSAAPASQEPIVRALLTAGANPSARSKEWFPLLRTSQGGATPAEVVRWRYTEWETGRLTTVGINKNGPSDYRQTLRLLEAAEARQKQKVKMRSKKKPDPSLAGGSGSIM